MGIHIGTGSESDDLETMSEINTTPLIDVMLVLLIMLIITIPIQLHSVNLNVPSQNQPLPAVPPEVVRIDIDHSGITRWNGEMLADQSAFEQRLNSAASQAVQPEIHIRPDKLVPYRFVAKAMSSIQRVGLTKVGLVGSEKSI